MESVSQNGILKEEFGKFKERTVKLRFMQQISYGVGAAMVFGLVTALANNLLFGSGLVAMTMGAAVGVGAIAAVGVGLIYMSAKFLSENTLLEQDFQAKKIGHATRAAQPTLEQSEVRKPEQFPARTVFDHAKTVPDAPVMQVQTQHAALEGRAVAPKLSLGRQG